MQIKPSHIMLLAIVAVVSTSCSKKKDSTASSTNPIPSAVAILQAALPATLESSAVASSSLQELEISPMVVECSSHLSV